MPSSHIVQSSASLYSPALTVFLRCFNMFILPISHPLVVRAWNTPPKGTIIAIEGAAEIWRHLLQFGVSCVPMMHKEVACVIWCLYHNRKVHSTWPVSIRCCLLSGKYENRWNPAMDRRAHFNWPLPWSSRGSLFIYEYSEGSPRFGAWFRQQQVYCHIDDSAVDDGLTRSNRTVD